jgi:hypothetical protein
MRTTLTLDDRIAAALKKVSFQSGKSFKDVVNETLRTGLAAKPSSHKRVPYRIKPVSLGAALHGINLDKALQLADTLEDEELGRKLSVRK